MKGFALLLCVLALAGCAQTVEREQEPEFGASVRHTIRMQTEFDGLQSFTTDGDKMLGALARYRGGASKGGSGGAAGDVAVSGYYRSDGTYVQPHMRSRPDGDPSNNFSTKGNINPYTGEMGTKPL